jgi:hypothetical protein
MGGVGRGLVKWDLQTERSLGGSQAATQDEISAAAVYPGGAVCAPSNQGFDILIWDAASLRLIATMGHGSGICKSIGTTELRVNPSRTLESISRICPTNSSAVRCRESAIEPNPGEEST